jgi:hypothetical protein
MKSMEKYKKRNRLFARLFLTAGIITAAAGIFLERTRFLVGIDPRLVTGLGILLLGLSLSAWMRYFSAGSDPKAALRQLNAESDERMTAIKNQAGQRGFWTALAIIYALLMWESLTSNGALTVLSPDARWYWLAAAVVVPLVVYITSVIQGNRTE